jgi:beta-glucosidase
VKTRIWICLLQCVLVVSCMAQSASPADVPSANPKPIYLNSHVPIDQRVADLLARMTPEEKAGQLVAPLGWMLYQKTNAGIEGASGFSALMQSQEPGTLYGVLRADAWTKVTLATGLTPRQSAEATNALQRTAIERSRLHIPLLFAEECAHGHMAIGATVFPTSLGQGSTWDPPLIRSMAAAIADETRSAGANICYGPILDLAREPRWGRMQETFGEDPFLAAQTGAAFVAGLQGARLDSPHAVGATLKHFIGYGQPEGGHNSSMTHAGPNEIESVFLPPFKVGVASGAVSILSSYNDIDGVPSTANEPLLTGVLRNQWGFRGFVVSDLYAIDGLFLTQHVATDLDNAAAIALHAGVDSDLGANAYSRLAKSVRDKSVSMEDLDRAVGRILRVKFQLGLFETPYVDPDQAAARIGDQENRALARHVAQESIILLKNSKNLLPLHKDIPSIAVIGPNADNIYNQLGDYTAPQPAEHVATVLDGIRAAVGPKTVVLYARGASIRGVSEADFAEALDAVRRSSIAVVVLGDSSARNSDTTYAATGAATAGNRLNESDMNDGEGSDRASLTLSGVQQALLQQIVQIGKPVVLVLIEGRPLDLSWASDNVPAIVDAWYPGEAGGAAIADVLFGDYNPGGKLPVAVPRSVGQLPVFYGHTRPDYVDLSSAPLYPFGFGLSYTTFAYSNLHTSTSGDTPNIDVSFDVSNTGDKPGDEVAQLYVHQSPTSLVTPSKALKGFQRVHLDPGATRTIHFHLGAEELAVFGSDNQWKVEPGAFDLMVGSSSEDIRLTTNLSLQPTITRK